MVREDGQVSPEFADADEGSLFCYKVLVDVHFGTVKILFMVHANIFIILIPLFFAEKLYDFLNIQLESDLNLKRSKNSFLSSSVQLFFLFLHAGITCCSFVLAF
jgi:hypothetical protein